MTKEHLIVKLISLNIHPKYFSISIEIKENAYNIEKLFDGKYAVYYLERGEKNELNTFDSEEEALSQLISCLEKNLKYGLDLSS